MKPSLLIGDLSRQTGCHIETIRYYERIGVLPTASRRGRYRCYQAQDVARLRFICRSRELGFSLEEVRTLLDLAKQGGVRSCGRVRALAADHLEAVRQRILSLQKLAGVLTEAVAQCDTDSKTHCPLIEALEAMPSLQYASHQAGDHAPKHGGPGGRARSNKKDESD